MKFSEVLKEVRSASGYTQQDVATILKTDRSTYAYYETGKTEPNIRSLRRLSNLFGISIDDMINGRIKPVCTSLSAKEEVDASELRILRTLSKEEREIVLLYRACANKDDLLDLIRRFEDADAQSE